MENFKNFEELGYKYNCNHIPQPYFIPGYCGYVPRLMYNYAQSFGQATNYLLRHDKDCAKILVPLEPNSRPASVCFESCEKGNESPCQLREKRPLCTEPAKEEKSKLFIPEHVCPSYQGYVSKTSAKRYVPLNGCCKYVFQMHGLTENSNVGTGEYQEENRRNFEKSYKSQNVGIRRLKDGKWLRFMED